MSSSGAAPKRINYDVQVGFAIAGLHEEPSSRSRLHTQVLPGELLEVVTDPPGQWLECRTRCGDYRGYVHRSKVSDAKVRIPTHRVVAKAGVLRFMGDQLDFKCPIETILPINALVSAQDHLHEYAIIGDGYAIKRSALWPIVEPVPHWIRILRTLRGEPYFWGTRGKGYDCSGLVQAGLILRGDQDVPHNVGMMLTKYGASTLVLTNQLMNGGLLTGDLIFWQGHVGVMVDSQIVLHTSKDTGEVCEQRLLEIYRARVAAGDDPLIKAVVRL